MTMDETSMNVSVKLGREVCPKYCRHVPSFKGVGRNHPSHFPFIPPLWAFSYTLTLIKLSPLWSLLEGVSHDRR